MQRWMPRSKVTKYGELFLSMQTHKIEMFSLVGRQRCALQGPAHADSSVHLRQSSAEIVKGLWASVTYRNR